MSTLSAFPFLGEQSFATPGAWNSPLSTISANIAAINRDVAAISGVTISPPSGNTIQMPSDLSISGYLSVGKGVSIGTQAPGTPEPVALTIGVNSGISDYIYFNDTANLRSDYLLGSHVGGTADGLNIFDVSGNTMIVSFSKQSIRFYQNVVGPVFDVGGALADTLNAATFGTGADSKESRVQAAISTASAAGISRVYVPASMYPYSAGSVSFDTHVQMVREGGNWAVYDVLAYGASPLGLLDSTIAIQAAESAASGAGGGEVYLPAGTFRINSTITVDSYVQLSGVGGNSVLSTSSAIGMVAIKGRAGSINLPSLLKGFRLYGSNVATRGLYCDVTSYGGLQNIHVDSVAGYGVALDGTQNILLAQVFVERSTHGVGLFNSVGNATLLNCHMNDISGYFLNVDDDASLPNAGWIGNINAHENTIRHCIWEMQSLKTTSNVSTKVRLAKADNSIFHDCIFGPNDQSSVLSSAISIRLGSNNNTFSNAVLSLNSGRFAAIANGGFGTLLHNPSFVGWGNSGVTCLTSSSRLLVLYPAQQKSTISVVDTGADTSQSVIWVEKFGAYLQFATPISANSITPVSGTTIDFGSSSLSMGGRLLISGGGTPIQFTNGSGNLINWNTLGVAAPTFTNYSAGVKAVFYDALGGAAAGYTLGINANTMYFTVPTAAAGQQFVWYGGTTSMATLDYPGNLFLGGASFLTVGSTITPGYAFQSEASLGLYRSGASTIAQSFGTFNLATNAVRLSMRTLAASSVTASAANTNVAVNEVVFTIGGASGASLCISSGGTTYIFSSALSAKNT